MRQLCICSWAARGDGQDLAPPVKSFSPPGRCFDTVISRDSWRERGLEEKARLVKLSGIKYDFRSQKTFESFFPPRNSARPFLLVLCEYLRDLVVDVFSSPEQDLALL